MATFEQLHLKPAPAAALAGLGWTPDDALAREVAPTAARGHNLVVVTPPTPAYAAPAVAGVLSRLGGAEQRALLVCPPVQVGEWGALCQLLAQGSELRVRTARGAASALRRLRAGALDLLVAPPDAVLALLARSALKLDDVAAVLIAWPEQYLDPDVLAPIIQDLGRDAQRIVYTAAPERVNESVERYARKGLIVGAPSHAGFVPAAVSRVRTTAVTWERRTSAVPELLELLDPASLVVWTIDRSHHPALARAGLADDPSIRIVTGDAPRAQLIVAFDLPDRARLEQLGAAGDVVLLVPPGTERYVEQLAQHRPVRLPGLLETAANAASADRAAIVHAIESGSAEHALLVLAPLFERHDPAAVAAALYKLWRRKTGHAAGAPLVDAPIAASATTIATANIYVGVGKKDGATANDLVAVLAKDLRVDRTRIGRIDLRETFTLVELPAQDAERIAEALDGMTLRRKRIRARLDRGGSRAGKR